MNKKYSKITNKEKIVYSGKMLEVVQQDIKFNNKIITFEWARRSPGIRLIIVSPDNKILLTREYRNEIKDYDYRIPGGKVFDSLKEYNAFLESGKDINPKIEQAVSKEIKEETGLQALKKKLFYKSIIGGSSIIWDLYYYVISKYRKVESGQNLEDGEDIEPIWMSPEKVKKLCLTGQINEDRSAAAILKYLIINSLI